MNNEEKILDLLTHLTGKVDSIDNRLGNVETRLGNVETRLDGVETRLTHLEEEVEIIKEDGQITRGATNAILDWITKAQHMVRVPFDE